MWAIPLRSTTAGLSPHSDRPERDLMVCHTKNRQTLCMRRSEGIRQRTTLRALCMTDTICSFCLSLRRCGGYQIAEIAPRLGFLGILAPVAMVEGFPRSGDMDAPLARAATHQVPVPFEYLGERI